MVSLREWHLQTRVGVRWRASSLLHGTFGVLGRVLTTVGERLHFGVSGRSSIAGGGFHESVNIDWREVTEKG